MEDATVTEPNDIAPTPFWARVEIMGHRRHHGLVRQVEQFGVKLLRVDVPAGIVPLTDMNRADAGTAEKFETFLYGGSAIFGVTPLTEKAARAWAAEDRRYSATPASDRMPESMPLLEHEEE